MECAIGVGAASLHHKPTTMPNGNFLIKVVDSFELKVGVEVVLTSGRLVARAGREMR